MPAATRLGDNTAGHGWSPTPSIKGSPDVFVNSLASIRIGDDYAVHSMPYPPVAPHKLNSAQGSTTVYANGLAMTRVGDVLSCTDTVAFGSSNVFIGG